MLFEGLLLNGAHNLLEKICVRRQTSFLCNTDLYTVTVKSFQLPLRLSQLPPDEERRVCECTFLRVIKSQIHPKYFIVGRQPS